MESHSLALLASLALTRLLTHSGNGVLAYIPIFASLHLMRQPFKFPTPFVPAKERYTWLLPFLGFEYIIFKAKAECERGKVLRKVRNLWDPKRWSEFLDRQDL